MEPELECVDATTGKSEGFGELKGGLMINTSLEFARQYVHHCHNLPYRSLKNRRFSPHNTYILIARLLTHKHPLLPLIAAQYPFEVAIGMNGRIWFKADAVDQTIALKRVLEAAEKGQLEYTSKAVGQLVKSMI
jgi:exosome complex component RRP40